MDFKTLLSEIREALGEDVGKVDAKLKKLERESESLSAELIDVKKEAKEKKVEIRGLKSQIEDKETSLQEWKTKAENPEGKDEFEKIKSENEKLKEQMQSVVAEKRKSLQSDFEKLAKHPKWDKAKDMFKFPEAKDGKVNFDDWTDEDIQHNTAKLQELNKLEYFGEVQESPSAFNEMQGQNQHEPDFDKINSPDDVFDLIAGEISKPN